LIARQAALAARGVAQGDSRVEQDQEHQWEHRVGAKRDDRRRDDAKQRAQGLDRPRVGHPHEHAIGMQARIAVAIGQVVPGTELRREQGRHERVHAEPDQRHGSAGLRGSRQEQHQRRHALSGEAFSAIRADHRSLAVSDATI
jgi:hypothetical protein